MDPNRFEAAIIDCLNHIDVDYMPLHDVFRSIAGFDKLVPSNNDFMDTLDLIQILLEEKNVICLEGSSMTPTKKSTSELITFLRSKWDLNGYNEIDYGIWFNKKES
jgi:hypothetical protein